MSGGLISRATLDDLAAFTQHSIRQMKELNTTGGYSHPFSPDHIWDEIDFAEKLAIKWSLPEGSPNWQIAWKLEVDTQVVGHLSLTMPSVVSSLHRVKLGMGIEEPYRQNGYGRALLATAILWSQQQMRISWIDLEVFSSNQHAIQLYQRFGFEEQGVCPDAYRIKGESVTNILMALKL